MSGTKTLRDAAAFLRLFVSTGPEHTTVDLFPEGIYVRSSWGHARVDIPLGIKPVRVDGQKFCDSILGMGEGEFALVNDGSALTLKCGASTSTLAAFGEVPGELPSFASDDALAPLKPAFRTALALASLSASDKLAALGLRAIMVETDENGSSFYATDNVTVALATILDRMPLPAKIAIPPEAVAVIDAIGKMDDVAFRATERAIVITAGSICAELALLAVPTKNVMDALAKFVSEDHTAVIPTVAAASYISLVQKLTDDRRKLGVRIAVSGTEMTLTMDEGSTRSEQVLLLKSDTPLPDASATISATALATALRHATSVVLDHLAEGVIVFTSSSPDFRFYIAGKGR